MSVRQLSVFVENKPGHLARLTTLLEQANVNVRGLSLGDTGDFGIVRLVVDKPDAALAIMEKNGILVKSTDLLCLELPDVPGALNKVLAAMAATGINLEYGYSLVSTFVCFKVSDVPEAEQRLTSQPVRIISQAELTNLF